MDFVNRGCWAGLSLLVALMTGCGWSEVEGSGKLVQEDRPTSTFMAIDVSDGLEVIAVVDPAQPTTVRVVGDDNLVGLVHTDTDPSTLHVSFQSDGTFHGGWTSPNPLRVEVTVPRLELLQSSGGGRAEVSGRIASNFFRLFSSGGGEVKARGLEVEELSLEVSGGGDAFLEGTATRVRSEISGGGSLRARGLATREAELSSSGGGEAWLQVSDTLKVKASGGSSVVILGHPQVLSKDLSGDSSLDFE